MQLSCCTFLKFHVYFYMFYLFRKYSIEIAAMKTNLIYDSFFVRLKNR